MYKNINVEAEHNELILENSNGDKVIIPANKRNWVKQKLSEGCHGCIDSLIETLPVAADYAQDGSLYSEYLTTDPPTKKTTQHPLDPNPDGSLPSYFEGSDANPIQLDEVVVTAEAPEWLKYRREYVKNNPFNIDEYVESRYNAPVGREAIKKIDGESWREELRKEGLQKRYNSAMDYVSEQLVRNKPQSKLSRAKWLNSMSDKEEELIKRNPKHQSSLWADTKRGLTSLVEQNPAQTFQNILTSSDYSNREKREMLKDYVDHPIMSKLGDAAKILNPLTVPSKMVQSAYKDDYSFTDALKGKKNNAGIVEDIVTDPLNLIGAGLAGKLSKADKVIDATKAGSKMLNKTDDVGKNLPKLSNTVDNQLPELPHEIVFDNNTINLERLNPKNKKQMLSFDDVDLGSDLTLRNNPSRVADQNTILGKNRSIKSVLNKKTNESIDLKTWQDTDGKIYYYMSANMPSSKLKAGKAYLELEKHIPKGEIILENTSLSYDSFLNVLKQTKNPKFETFVKGKIPMNDNAKNNLLKIKGDSYLGSNYFNSEELANSANKELIELTNKYSLPNPTVVPVTSSSGKIKAYEIQLPNIGLKKLYTILGLTSAGTYLQSQQNKDENKLGQ